MGESSEIDGPVDDPLCCNSSSSRCCSSAARSLLHQERQDGLPAIVQEQQNRPARLGFPESKRRGGKYPTASAENGNGPMETPLALSSVEARSERSPQRPQECRDCKDCKLSL